MIGEVGIERVECFRIRSLYVVIDIIVVFGDVGLPGYMVEYFLFRVCSEWSAQIKDF